MLNICLKHIKLLNKSVRPFLGQFWAHLGDKQPQILAENYTFLGPPFMLCCRIFSHLATVQQTRVTKEGFYA